MAKPIVTQKLAGFVRHQGMPISGARVLLLEPEESLGVGSTAMQMLSETQTNAKGEFYFDVSSGHYYIEVIPNPSTRFLRQNASVSVGNETKLNITLQTGSIVSGTVRTAGGEALNRGELVFLAIEPAAYSSAIKIESNGTFAVTLPRGRYHVGFRDSRSNDDEEPLERTVVSQHVTILEVASDMQWDFHLPELIDLNAEIQDASGAAVPNARIEIFPTQTNERLLARELNVWGFAESDESGCFRFAVPPGEYEVRIDPGMSGLLFGLRETVNCTGSGTTKFKVAQAFRLRGKVVYEEQPFANCLIRVQGMDKNVEVIVRSDEKGEFCASMPSGSYRLIVMPSPKLVPMDTIDGIAYPTIAPWTKEIEVRGDTHVAVGLQSGVPVYGRVLNDRGAAWESVKIAVFAVSDNKQASETAEQPLATGITDGEGRYCFCLLPGTYWLAAGGDLVNAKKVEIGTEPRKRDIAWTGWCRVVVQVEDEQSTKLPRCRVRFAPYWSGGADVETIYEEAFEGSARGYSITNNLGRCELLLPASVYTFQIDAPPDSSFDSKSIKQISISGDWTRTLKLPRKS